MSPANINCLTGCCGCCSRDGDYLNSFDDTVTYSIFIPTATSCDTYVVGSDFDAGGGVASRHTPGSSRLMFCHKEISDFNGLVVTFNVTLGTVANFSIESQVRFENLKSNTMILLGYFGNIFPPTIRLGGTILATAGSVATFASGDVLTMTMTDTGAADGHMDIDFLQNGISLVTASNVDIKCLFNPSASGCAGTALAPGAFFFGVDANSSSGTFELAEYDLSYHY